MDLNDYKQKNTGEIHFWHKARKNLINALVSSCLKGTNNDRDILDIGCGTGTELEILKRYGNVTALDVDTPSLQLAKKYNVELIKADIENYNFTKQYDVICAFDILEHLRDDQSVINKIFSGLKNDGYFIFSVPAHPVLFGPHDIALNHKRRYSKSEIKLKLERSGFQIIKFNYWNTLLFPLMALLRIFKKLFFKRNAEFLSEAKTPNIFINNILFSVLNWENKSYFFNKKKFFGLTIYGICIKK